MTRGTRIALDQLGSRFPGNQPINYHLGAVKHGKEILEVVDGNAISGVAYKVE
jgi:hypothetical protein